MKGQFWGLVWPFEKHYGGLPRGVFPPNFHLPLAAKLDGKFEDVLKMHASPPVTEHFPYFCFLCCPSRF